MQREAKGRETRSKKERIAPSDKKAVLGKEDGRPTRSFQGEQIIDSTLFWKQLIVRFVFADLN